MTLIGVMFVFYVSSRIGIQIAETCDSVQARLVIITPLGDVYSSWVSQLK